MQSLKTLKLFTFLPDLDLAISRLSSRPLLRVAIGDKVSRNRTQRNQTLLVLRYDEAGDAVCFVLIGGALPIIGRMISMRVAH